VGRNHCYGEQQLRDEIAIADSIDAVLGKRAESKTALE
jgi:hypothetical protein